MIYKFCRAQRIDGDLWIELDDIDRATALDYVKQHKDSLQKFAERGTGFVFGWCAEIDARDRTRALLYEHKDHGLIWIETCC